MKKLRKSLGNEGFTLVELIIVIAIIATLVAILAPQYLKYVEKSRISADKSNASEILNAVQVATSDPDVTLTAGTYKVTWTGTSIAVAKVTDGDDASVTALANELGTTLNLTFTAGSATVAAPKSTTYKTDTFNVEIVVSSTSSAVTSGWTTADSFTY